MPIGVLLGFVSYGSFAFGDALIKSFGDSLSVFEIAFFVTLFSFVPALVVKPRGERWREAWRLRHPVLTQIRGLLGICSMVLVTIAFTTIPLAETYALIFLTPILVTILSVAVLRETMTPLRWVVLAIGFAGVMLVVRPGFRALEAGHFAAMGAAIAASFSAIILKKISTNERRVSLLGVLLLYAMIFNGIAMIPTFQMPTLHQFGVFLLIGIFGGTGQLVMIAATRRAAANQIAPTQYSQIFWAILLGGLFYNEYPDTVAVIGLIIVVLAGIGTPGVEAARTILGARLARFGRQRPPVE
ncbi:DMT family transporter [Pelagibacterium sediminicola]|uniref:DMT family transporter n=1 Tax=Pelagibacterium sediminicola TaxID=2248761 RepID=UPI000E3134D8|nr:DMT family transporter [Pelagibacterium sediminicola]